MYLKHLEELKPSSNNQFSKAVSTVIAIAKAMKAVSSSTEVSAPEIKTVTKEVTIDLSHTITAEKLENTSAVKSKPLAEDSPARQGFEATGPTNRPVENFPFQPMKHHFQSMNHRLFDLPMHRGGYWYAVGCLSTNYL